MRRPARCAQEVAALRSRSEQQLSEATSRHQAEVDALTQRAAEQQAAWEAKLQQATAAHAAEVAAMRQVGARLCSPRRHPCTRVWVGGFNLCSKPGRRSEWLQRGLRPPSLSDP